MAKTTKAKTTKANAVQKPSTRAPLAGIALMLTLEALEGKAQREMKLAEAATDPEVVEKHRAAADAAVTEMEALIARLAPKAA